ncbi:MAG: thioredoxin family protein, partial [Bacteroidota bacterium]
VIMNGKLNLYQLPTDYTLLLFWATWCPHCVQVVPEIKKAVEQYLNPKSQIPNLKSLMVVAVSLDTDKEQWQKFVTEKNLLSFINFSEYKGWQSEAVKKFNVYATPTMFLLDKDKKIIAKPETTEQLINNLTTESMRK